MTSPHESAPQRALHAFAGTPKSAEFETSPSLPLLFAKSVLPGARRKDELPENALTLAAQTIDADRLARYQRVCGFAVSHVVPSTYLHVLAFPVSVALMTDRAFPVPLPGLVHVENVITSHRAVHADEPVSFAVRTANLRPHRSGRQFDMLAEAHSSGELVWTGRSTYLHRESTSNGEASGRTVPEPWSGPTRRLRIPADIGRRYAAVSGDRNPIHLYRATARLFGFRRPIAHGMWLAARTLAALEGRVPDVYSLDVAFKAPVLLPSTVLLGTRPTASGWVVDVRAERSGKPHLTGVIEPR